MGLSHRPHHLRILRHRISHRHRTIRCRTPQVQNVQQNSVPQPPASSNVPPAPQTGFANTQTQPGFPQNGAQPQNTAQFGAPANQSFQQGFDQNQFPQPPAKQPNPFVEAFKAQGKSLIALKNGSYEAATAEAVPHKFYWIINFVLVAVSYGLIGANILKGILGTVEIGIKAMIIKAVTNAAGGLVGSDYINSTVSDLYDNYVPDMKIGAGPWFLMFFVTFVIVLVLLLARVGLMQVTYSMLKTKVPFTTNANIYASTLGLHFVMAFVIGLLTFIPVPTIIYILLAIAFIVGNVVGVLSEISLHTAARAYSQEKSPLVPFLGFLAVWYLILLIGIALYARLAFGEIGTIVGDNLSHLTDILGKL